MKSKGLLGLLAVLGILFFWGCNVQRGLVSSEENIGKVWGDVQSQYQRRADVLKNVVASAKAAAENEKSILTGVTNARSGITTGATDANSKIDAAKTEMGKAVTPTELDAALRNAQNAAGGFKIQLEAYPQIRSTDAFLKLQDEVAGTENRISKVRETFNEAVKPYNTKIRQFPGSLMAGILGFKTKLYFEAAKGSENAPDLNSELKK